MSLASLARRLLLLTLLTAAALSTGCVTSGRRVLLKEYGPSVPAVADAPLQGVTIALRGFTCAPDLVSLEVDSKPEEPEPFHYMDLPRDQDKIWAKEMAALQKQTPESSLRKIGNMRNGFGMVMSHVYALNDPAAWFTQALKFDLEAQGAKVVDPAAAGNADVTVSGTIAICRADMYFTVNGTLVVDLEVQPKNGPARHRRIHTRGATMASLASEGEYFHALRDARQKFSIVAIREIAQAMKPSP